MTLKSPTVESGKVEKVKKRSKKSLLNREPDKESVHLVAQEIKFARSLAGNEKKSRDRVLKTLRKWINIRCEKKYEFKEDDFNRIWKGLFYAMWMSDKPLIQEELSEAIAGLLDVFPAGSVHAATLFFKCGLRSLATEWYGLDQHRMDKFLMFVRRLLRGALRAVSRDGWSTAACRQFASTVGADDCVLHPSPPAYARNALALQLHVVECYAEELAKVSEGKLPDAALVELTRPFARCMALSRESRLSGAIKRHLFVHLLKQSQQGLEYEEKKRAWTQMGCPEGGVDCIEPISEDEDDNSGSESEDEVSSGVALDPRAGHVDAVLPSLCVPAAALADMLRPLVVDKNTRTDNRKRVRTLLQHFEDLSTGRYPLRAKEQLMSEAAATRRGAPRPARAADRLREFEKKVIAESDELALRGLSRKHRKRVLVKHRERLLSGDAPASADSTRKKGKNGIPNGLPSPDKVKRKSALPNGLPSDKSDRTKRKRRTSDSKSSGEWKVEDASPGKKNTKEMTKKEKPNKRKAQTALVDEVPLKKLKNLLKQKESAQQKTGDSRKLKKTEKTEQKAVKKPAKTEGKKEGMRKVKSKIVCKKMTHSATKLASPKKFEKKSSSEKKDSEPPKLRGKKSSLKKTDEVSVDEKRTPKKVTIVLRNNTAQGPVDYYQSVKQSPSIPFDSSKKPVKTNLKPNSTPSPINPFFKKKLKLKL